MTSTGDNQQIINKGLENFKFFSKVTYPQGIAIITSILGSVMMDYDISGLKSSLPDEIWNNLTENQNIDGTIRAKPMPLVPPPQLGPRPALPINMADATAEDLNRLNTMRNFYNDNAADNIKLQNTFDKFIAVKSYLKTAFIAQASNKDKTAYNILIRNRNTGDPDQDGISIESVFENYVDHFGDADEDTLDKWQSQLETKRKSDEPISEFMIKWNSVINTLNNNGRFQPDYQLIEKFQKVTDNDPRCVKFLELFKSQFPNSKSWDEIVNFSIVQQPNLDAKLETTKSAFTATDNDTTTTALSVSVSGGGVANTTTGITTAAGGAVAQNKRKKYYCFIHGTPYKGQHASKYCTMIKLGEQAYPYDNSGLKSNIRFTTQAQIDQIHDPATTSKTNIPGIGKGK